MCAYGAWAQPGLNPDPHINMLAELLNKIADF